jgi:hypothetical protein
MMRKILTVGAVALGAFALSMSAVTAADSLPLSWDQSTGVFGDPGTHLVLATSDVPTEKVGKTCEVVVDIGNNDSVRQGSDVTVTTGDASHLFANTEGVAGNAPPVTLHLVMGSTITSTLTFADDGAYSGSGTVAVGACEEPPPTTTTTPPSVSPEVVVRPVVAPAAVVASPVFTG